MNLLKKCPKCKDYTLRDSCKKCNSKTSDANHKFSKIPNAPSRRIPFKK